MIYLKLLLKVFLVMYFAEAKSFPTDKTRHVSLRNMIHSLTRISNSIKNLSIYIEENKPGRCDKPIGDTRNAYTDWNPEATYIHGEKVTVTCKDGFAAKNKATKHTISCLLGNHWSKFQPCTEEVCTTRPYLAKAHNSDINRYINTFNFVNDTITIKCLRGFGTKDKSTEQIARCLPGNIWTDIEECSQICTMPFARYRNLCLFIDDTLRTWNESLKSCSNINPEADSTLLMLQTRQKQEDFFMYYQMLTKQNTAMNKNFWLGVNDMQDEGFFKWNDETPFTLEADLFSWHEGQPDNWKGDEDCAGISTGSIFDRNCDLPAASICEVPI